MRATTEYLSPSKPRIFAHRGFTTPADGDVLDENTIAAFAAAIVAGATHIETDIQVTSDGVAVLFHDDDLSRVTQNPPIHRKISELSFQEVQAVRLTHGGQIPALIDALDSLREVRFNLDFKVNEAVKPASKVINDLNAAERVLVSAFSERRRHQVLREIAQPVATSAGSALVVWSYLVSKIGAGWLLKILLRNVNALQIPVSAGPFDFASPRFISSVQRCGVEVHFWTINAPSQMKKLIALGADGIVTDRTDLAATAFLPLI